MKRNRGNFAIGLIVSPEGRRRKVETTIVAGYAGSTAANKDGCGSERRKIGKSVGRRMDGGGG